MITREELFALGLAAGYNDIIAVARAEKYLEVQETFYKWYQPEEEEMIETKVIKPRYGDMPQVYHHDNETLTKEGAAAIEFVARWGMVAGMPDGEDTSGRAKLRLATPEEVVERACTIASLLWTEMRGTGLIHKFETIEQMEALFPEKEDERS